ncbi:OR43A protein, partial [Acromyrmex heyeri]
IFQIRSFENFVHKFYLPLMYAVSIILYMFLSNNIGQNIIDHNNYVLSTAYNVQWYRAPLRIQRMILFLLQRETKMFTLNVGGLFNASMECFATLVKTSVSYFTVIYSTR